MKILVTGSAGFICGYLIQELLEAGYEVIGLDNYSKYGQSDKSYDTNARYTFVQGDAKDTSLLKELVSECDHFVAAAAMIGGISYFHEFAYDLLAENERITTASFDAAIWAHRERKLRKITVISSSMVSRAPASSRRQREQNADARRRDQLMDFRSWRQNTSFRVLMNNISFHTRLFVLSIALASARSVLCVTVRSPAAM